MYKNPITRRAARDTSKRFSRHLCTSCFTAIHYFL